MYWNRLSDRLREAYGGKVYKLALSSGCSCPNRDGTIDTRGCIFCDGAGACAAAGDIPTQLAEAKRRVAIKAGENARYIAYFQSFTNTHGSVGRLRTLYMQAMADPEVVILSIATRPDCLGEEVMALLQELNAIKPVWVELGLQTIHPTSAAYIRRGYDLSVFEEAVAKLRAAGIEVIVHQILGLPGETTDMMTETAQYIGQSGAQGIKFHLLHVLQNTDLAAVWQAGNMPIMDMETYISVLEACVRRIPREMVIHRLTGDGAKRDLLAPLWSGDKKRVLNAIHAAFLRDDVEQGSDLL